MASSVVLNAEAPEFYPNNTLHKLQQPPQYNDISYYPFHFFYPSSSTTKHPHPFYYPSHFHPNHQHSLSKHEHLINEDPHRCDAFKGNNHVCRRKQEPKKVHVTEKTKHHDHRRNQRHYFRTSPRQHLTNKRGGGGGCGGGFPEVPVFPGGNKTTVMLKNIPCKYTRKILVEFLENHCMLENAKENENGEETTFAFDFVYLPIDFTTGCSKGYAFVNFTKPMAAWKFDLTASNKKWELFLSNKIRRVIAARLQGKEELEKHFETMKFPCESEEVLPVSFHPPRDGVIKGSQKTMGKLSKNMATKMPLYY